MRVFYRLILEARNINCIFGKEGLKNHALSPLKREPTAFEGKSISLSSSPLIKKINKKSQLIGNYKKKPPLVNYFACNAPYEKIKVL